MNPSGPAGPLADESASHLLFEKMRWPEGVRCVRCSAARISRISSEGKSGKPRLLYQCLVCRKQFTVKSGTLFHDSHLPVDKWLLAIGMIVQNPGRLSTAELARALEVQYRTAANVGRRLRAALGAGELRGTRLFRRRSSPHPAGRRRTLK